MIKNRDEGDHREYCSDIVIVCNKLSDWELREMRRRGLSKTAVVEAFRKVVFSYRLRLLSVLLAPLQQQQEEILPRASVNTILECFSHVRQFPKPLSGAEWMRNAARYWEVTKAFVLLFPPERRRRNSIHLLCTALGRQSSPTCMRAAAAIRN